MTKPRIFVSSTYYDLKYIRDNLETFISQMGYEPVLFESGDIPYERGKPLDESAYKELDNCHMQILILGGRYGSPTSSTSESIKDCDEKSRMYEHYNSITKTEYEKARNSGMPIFIFVESGVYAEYQTYKRNRENTSINYAHVDSINIFKLLDDVLLQRISHYVKDFETFEDISSWLTEQWAGLFTNYLTQKTTEQKIITIESQIEDLKGITIALKEYTEALMRKIKPDGFSMMIEKQSKIMETNEANRFVREKPIRFLLKRLNITLPPEKILEKYKMSNDLDEFLANTNVSESHPSYKGTALERDFEELKLDYQKEIGVPASGSETAQIEEQHLPEEN